MRRIDPVTTDRSPKGSIYTFAPVKGDRREAPAKLFIFPLMASFDV